MVETILIVDDEEKIREIITVYLKKNGYNVIEAKDGEEALNKFQETSPDLIVLDLMLPYIDGLQVCKMIRKDSSVPIIMLTARGEEYDKIKGLDIGADDYIAKPFSPNELVARIKAVLRRTLVIKDTKIIKLPGLIINKSTHQVFINSIEIVLSPKEFDLLWIMVNNLGRVFDREMLLETVWGYDYSGDIRTVDTHIKRLREKLSSLNYQGIKTVWGLGYKFEVT